MLTNLNFRECGRVMPVRSCSMAIPHAIGRDRRPRTSPESTMFQEYRRICGIGIRHRRMTIDRFTSQVPGSTVIDGRGRNALTEQGPGRRDFCRQGKQSLESSRKVIVTFPTFVTNRPKRCGSVASPLPSGAGSTRLCLSRTTHRSRLAVAHTLESISQTFGPAP